MDWMQRFAAIGMAGIALGALFLGGCNNGANTQANTQNVVAQTDESKPHTHDESKPHTHDESQPHSHDDGSGDANDSGLGVHARNTKLEVSMQPRVLVPNKMAMWTLRVLDKKSGQPVQDFQVEMTKLMHLIVVNTDLSWFNHIHPAYKGNGVFTVSAMVPRDGSYKLYADYTPKGGTQEVPQYTFSAFTNVGVVDEASPLLVVDKADAKGWMTQTVVSRPEGQPEGASGASYQVALMPMPTKVVSGQDVMLHFQVRDGSGRPVKDLQPYLGTMGHLVVLSSDTNIYLHSHPMSGAMSGMKMKGMKHDEQGGMAGMGMAGMGMAGMGMAGMDMGNMDHGAAPKSGGPDVVFHTNFPKAGIYKAWGQFRHRDKIITAPFVLDVGQGAAKTTTPSSTRTGEKSAQNVVYTCPMHPEVQAKKPGDCPKCNMALVPKA